jgi:hypothetical protein
MHSTRALTLHTCGGPAAIEGHRSGALRGKTVIDFTA